MIHRVRGRTVDLLLDGGSRLEGLLLTDVGRKTGSDGQEHLLRIALNVKRYYRVLFQLDQEGAPVVGRLRIRGAGSDVPGEFRLEGVITHLDDDSDLGGVIVEIAPRTLDSRA